MTFQPEYEQAGHPYSQEKRLGRVMWVCGWQEVYKLAGKIEVSPRQLSRFLAGDEIPPHILAKLAEELDCPGEYLQEEENGGAPDPRAS